MGVETIKSDVEMSWKSVKIPEVLFFQEGPGVRNTQFTNSGVKLLNVGNINLGNLNLDATKIYISEDEAYGKYKHFLVEEGDLLIASSGIIVDNFHNKISWAKREHLPLCLNTSTIRFRTLDSSVLDIKFFSYFLKTRLFANQLSKLITGSAQLNFGPSHLKQISLPLPPLATQKRIAEILDAADALRRKDQELLKKYDELAQAIFIDMFGDPVKNEKGWEKVKMEKLMTIVRGGSPRPIDKFLGGKYPWIKIGDATKGDDVYLSSTREHIIEEGLSKTRLLPVGSLIFANCGVSLGFARIITFEGCIHDGWLAFSDFDDLRINKIFLLKALNSITQYFRDSAPEGTQPNLNTGIIKDFELILPPLALQNKFELILNSFKGIKDNAECNFKNSNQLFDSIIQTAFKGELVS